MNHDTEPLKILTLEQMPQLLTIMESNLPYSMVACNFVKNVINWKRKRPDKNYYTLMVPKEHCEYGTFICIMQLGSYDLFVFTLDKNCKKLYEGLIGTKYIDWSREILYTAICEDQGDAVRRAMKTLNLKIYYEMHNEAWVKEKEKCCGDEITIPPDVYIAPLTKDNVDQVNKAWPLKFPNSEKVVENCIEMNYGYGVFRKENDELMAWVIKTYLGCLGILQVEEKHFRKGYGSLITNYVSKKMAEEDGIDAAGFVVKTNAASRRLFDKLGFYVLYSVVYFFTNHKPYVLPEHCNK